MDLNRALQSECVCFGEFFAVFILADPHPFMSAMLTLSFTSFQPS